MTCFRAVNYASMVESRKASQLTSAAVKNNIAMTENNQCPNCQTPLYGMYCAGCGQSQKSNRRMLWTLISEAFEDIFRFDSKAWRTSYALFFKPGYLSNEYFAGRRARYVQPIRLYLVTSIVFFFTISIINYVSPGEVRVQGDGAVEQSKQSVFIETDESSEAVLPETDYQKAQTDSAEPAAAEGEISSEGKTRSLNGSIEPGDLELPFVSAERTEKIRLRMNRQIEKASKILNEEPEEFMPMLLDIMPPIAFLLLPLFALLLKIFYVFKRMFYTEHLILAVHNHSLLFAALTVHSIVDVPIEANTDFSLGIITFPLLAFYMYKSLRIVYQQSRAVTLFKFVCLGLGHMTLTGVGFFIAMLIGVMAL